MRSQEITYPQGVLQRYKIFNLPSILQGYSSVQDRAHCRYVGIPKHQLGTSLMGIDEVPQTVRLVIIFDCTHIIILAYNPSSKFPALKVPIQGTRPPVVPIVLWRTQKSGCSPQVLGYLSPINNLSHSTLTNWLPYALRLSRVRVRAIQGLSWETLGVNRSCLRQLLTSFQGYPCTWVYIWAIGALQARNSNLVQLGARKVQKRRYQTHYSSLRARKSFVLDSKKPILWAGYTENRTWQAFET